MSWDLLDHLGPQLALEQVGATGLVAVGVEVVGVGVVVGGVASLGCASDSPACDSRRASRATFEAGSAAGTIGAGVRLGDRPPGAAGGGEASASAPGSTIVSIFQSAPTTSIAACRTISALPPASNDSLAPELAKTEGQRGGVDPDHLGVLGQVDPGHPAALLGGVDDVRPQPAYVDQAQVGAGPGAAGASAGAAVAGSGSGAASRLGRRGRLRLGCRRGGRRGSGCGGRSGGPGSAPPPTAYR